MMPTKSASTSSTPGGGKSAKKAGPHSIRDGRGRFAPSSSLPGSPGAAAATVAKNLDLHADAEEVEPEEMDSIKRRLRFLEEIVSDMEKEKKSMKEELWKLRDRLEEEVWERRKLEEKLKQWEEGEELEKRLKTEVKVVMDEGWKEEMKEVVREETKKEMEVKKDHGGREVTVGGESRHEEQKYKCVVLTDSNGRGLTPESVKSHMPTGERQKYDVQMVVAYRLEDAFNRIRRGEIEVKDSYVVIDNVTNNVKGNWKFYRETPEQVVHRIAALRELILASSAAAVVVCEVKPMAMIDVRPYNRLIHDYLQSCGKGGYGCNTQIRQEYLAPDGTHIDRRFSSVLDRTYACALLGTAVPEQLLDDDFVPLPYRRSWDKEWPRLVGNRGPGNFLPR